MKLNQRFNEKIQIGPFPTWPSSSGWTLRQRCFVCRLLGRVRVSEGTYIMYPIDNNIQQV